MKTIEEMWQEWNKKQVQEDIISELNLEKIVTAALRRAFFAGFNRAYNATLDNVVLIEGPRSIFSIPQYESEMDAHSEEVQ